MDATYRLRSGQLTTYHPDMLSDIAKLYYAYTQQEIDEDVVAHMLSAADAWREREDQREREHYFRAEIAARESAALANLHAHVRLNAHIRAK